jgi:arylsulfatase A-like enzyme
MERLSFFMRAGARGLDRALFPRDLKIISPVDVPSWVNSEGDGVTVRRESGQNDEYFAMRTRFDRRPAFTMALRDDDKTTSVELTPSESFTELDFEILSTENTDSLSVTVDYETADGTTRQESLALIDGKFNDANTFDTSISLPEPAINATVSMDATISRSCFSNFRYGYNRSLWKDVPGPWLSVPAARGTGGPPIFLISVDTFRYDYLDTFDPLLKAMDGDAVIPAEPRTQGHWTRPSHASTFTGVHPATHGFVATGGGSGHGPRAVNPDLVTLPELLADNQYKCSSCLVSEKLGPKYGFGRGFHRGRYRPMSWGDRHDDAADIVNQVSEWVSTDTQGDSKQLFYFMHLFDAHYPYVPPRTVREVDEFDFELLDQYNNKTPSDYLEVKHTDPFDYVTDDELEHLTTYYRAALAYVARQLRRLIVTLKEFELYEDALIIVVGDHGEDFLEREFFGHRSLTDANIRPGMIVKPPADRSFSVPDSADLIDVLPTIAHLIGATPPDQCHGVAWQTNAVEKRPRITERIKEDWYNVSVELSGMKGIFTYEENFPNRPTASQVADGPVETEYYDVAAVRRGDHQATVDPGSRAQLQTLAAEFIRSKPEIDTGRQDVVDVSPETKRRLEELGYR